MKVWHLGLIVLAAAGGVIFALRSDEDPSEPVDHAITMVLDPSFGCARLYTNGGGQEVKVPANSVPVVELDSLSSSDTTTPTFNLQLQRQVDREFVGEGPVHKVPKNSVRERYRYPGIVDGRYRVAFWRDSADCRTAEVRSATKGARLVVRDTSSGGESNKP